MKNFINGIDFHNLEAQKYWAPTASWSDERKKQEVTSMIFSGDYVGARKMDGAFYKFVKDEDGNMELLGRSKSVSGDYLNKIDWVPQFKHFFDYLPNGTCYQPGKRPARQTCKVKRELEESIDAVILDANAPTRDYTGKEIETWQYWEDIKTGEKLKGEFYREYDLNGSPEPVTKNYFYGWAGSLVIGLYNTETGKYNPIGSLSGLTEEVLSNWKDYRGKVVEVTGMQIFRDENGKFSGIRHPKLKAFRDDKAAKECTFEQVK